LKISTKKHETKEEAISTKKPGTKEEVVQFWIVSSHIGTGAALEMAKKPDRKNHGLMPCGAVAAKLTKKGQHYYPHKISGEVFCFLPLSLKSNLPVHVNGAFAVASNRRDLWHVTDQDKFNYRGLWNQALMEDPVCRAYIRMLECVSGLLPKDRNEKELDR